MLPQLSTKKNPFRCIAVTKSTYKEERVVLDHNFNACGPVALGLWQAARGDSSVWQSKCSPGGQKQKGKEEETGVFPRLDTPLMKPSQDTQLLTSFHHFQ